MANLLHNLSAHPTRVTFRMFMDEALALFPDIPWDVEGKYVTSYMRVGQHAAADYPYVLSESRPATPQEYADLLVELGHRGYENLSIVE